MPSSTCVLVAIVLLLGCCGAAHANYCQQPGYEPTTNYPGCTNLRVDNIFRSLFALATRTPHTSDFSNTCIATTDLPDMFSQQTISYSRYATAVLLPCFNGGTLCFNRSLTPDCSCLGGCDDLMQSVQSLMWYSSLKGISF